jgi:hypothetical protein
MGGTSNQPTQAYFLYLDSEEVTPVQGPICLSLAEVAAYHRPPGIPQNISVSRNGTAGGLTLAGDREPDFRATRVFAMMVAIASECLMRSRHVPPRRVRPQRRLMPKRAALGAHFSRRGCTMIHRPDCCAAKAKGRHATGADRDHEKSRQLLRRLMDMPDREAAPAWMRGETVKAASIDMKMFHPIGEAASGARRGDLISARRRAAAPRNKAMIRTGPRTPRPSRAR